MSIEQADLEDSPGQRPILRKGSKGDDVAIVQHLFGIKEDDDFGELTEAAVKGFQVGVGLAPTGIIDAETWHQLDGIEQVPVEEHIHHGITAAVLKGFSDEEYGVAVPAEHMGDYSQVVVTNLETGKDMLCEILGSDVHLPQGAGVAVTAAVATAIGIEDGDKVDWAYAVEHDEGE